MDKTVGSWYYMSGCFYVIVNEGGTVERWGPVSLWKRFVLELRQCFNKPMHLAELRKYIGGY